MVQFQHNLPELAENPLPPALAGEIVTETKLHRLRLRQLQDLAKAYGIDLPDGATKNEVLPILVTHERAGAFRKSPVSQYHLLHAEISHDQKLEQHQRDDRDRRLAAALEAETKTKPVDVQPTKYDLFSIDDLRAKAKAMGMNSFQKSKAQLIEMILAEESRVAGTAEDADQGAAG